MEFSKLKDRFNKETAKKALDFVKRHVRYFSAGALFVVLVLVLVFGTQPKIPDETLPGTSETDTQVAETYQVDAFQEVNQLIQQYYTAYVSGDVGTLSALAVPLSANEQSYISMFSQYVEAYQNIKCYTKSGPETGSYLVSVEMELKFTGVDTVAPGLDFFYVRTNEDGSLYIDNLYSTYNRNYKEVAADAGVQLRIEEFEEGEDLMALQREVQGRYDTAIASDENLSNMILTTIPNAVREWRTVVVAQSTEQPTESPEEPTEVTTEQPTETPEEPPAAPEEPAVTETLTATDKVNVRAAADTSAEKLGTVERGQTVTRTGTEGDWSIIDYNGATGYIKSEYLTTSASGSTATDETADPIAEGTVVTLQNTVNVRSSMSETADKVGTAYAGEKVTVIMSYAEGWTKVNWNSKTGYIKTSLLQ